MSFIAAHAPLGCCEGQRSSKFSTKPVDSSEILARFSFSPLHVVTAKGAAKPSIFSQVTTNGCSVQRDSVASDDELSGFIQKFIDEDEDRSWNGVLVGRCQDVRTINILGLESHQSVCVYDTAEKYNPAHAELFHSQYQIDEADKVELRAKLMKAFGDGKIVTPAQFRDGRIKESLRG